MPCQGLSKMKASAFMARQARPRGYSPRGKREQRHVHVEAMSSHGKARGSSIAQDSTTGQGKIRGERLHISWCHDLYIAPQHPFTRLIHIHIVMALHIGGECDKKPLCIGPPCTQHIASHHQLLLKKQCIVMSSHTMLAPYPDEKCGKTPADLTHNTTILTKLYTITLSYHHTLPPFHRR